MKTLLYSSAVALSLNAFSLCDAQQVNQVPPPTQPSIISRAANARVWQRTFYSPSPSGQIISQNHYITEIADGLCYQDPITRQWMDSQENITIQPDGSAAAVNGRHHASFPANIYEGAVILTTPEGLQITSQPILLSYESGTNIIPVASLTSSVGELISSNQIIYKNAFAEVDADMLYNYTKSGIEQDLVLRQQLPPPEQFGLNSADTRLQLLTEFINPPEPAQAIGPVNPHDGLQDTILSFGSMTMRHGSAFLTSASPSPHDLHSVPVYKSWIVVDGRTFLVEEVPYQRLSPDLATLPPPPAVNPQNVNLRKPSPKRALPPVRLVRTSTNTVHLAKIAQIPRPGVTFDYVIVNAGETNFTFKGDTVYYVSAGCILSGTTTIEGGAVIKFNGSGLLEIAGNGTLDCQTAPYRPAVFTSFNDDSIGEPIWGVSSGSPYFSDVNLFLSIDPTNMSIHDLRFSYAVQAIAAANEPDFLNVSNSQFLNVLIPIWAYDVGLYNDLFGYSADETNAINGIGLPELFIDGGLVAENVTSDSGYGFINADYTNETLALTNCLVTRQMLTNEINGTTLLTNAVVYLPSPSSPVYQAVGGGNYYLTTNSPGRGVGTTNIAPALLSELKQKTTWPPVIYDAANISSLGNLGPDVPRDANSLAVDVGYHYDPLDYAFGGCDLYSNLTVAAGTAVAWFEDNGGVSPGSSYGISLDDGANLSFNGNASQPCVFTRSEMAQEGGNGNWENTGWGLGIVFMGSSQEATVSANFTRWTSTLLENILQDRGSMGQGFFENCEFYYAAITTWNVQYLDFTNCLFWRSPVTLWDSPNFTLENCTAFNGGITMDRSSAVNWLIENCSFDGTALNGSDSYSANTNYTTIGFNAYNTNNLSWQTYPVNPPYTGKLEVTGASDVLVTNYNWETSWFGNFYLPTNSPIINAGSTMANLLGLYHFTTQTNQAVEGNSTVDIGYHYVATDSSGNPLDSNGNGIPDYIEDTNGMGILGPQIILIAPATGSSFTEPATIPIQASVSDWSSPVTNVDLLQSNGLQGVVSVTGIANTPYNYLWPIVAVGKYAVQGIAQDLSGLSATSSVVNVTVTNLCGY